MLCLKCRHYFVFLDHPAKCPKCGGPLGKKELVKQIKIRWLIC